MIRKITQFILAAFLFTVWLSCNKESEIGKSLLQFDEVNVAFDDTLSVDGYTTQGFPVVTFDATQTTKGEIYLLGNITDPLFGKAEAEMFLQIEKLDTSITFKGHRLDSIVLILPYDTTFIYHWGDTLKPFSLEVRQLVDTMPNVRNVRDFYSNVKYPSSRVLGHLDNFYPRPKTKITEIDNYSIPGRSDTLSLRPVLTIRLDNALGQEIMNAPDSLLTDLLAFRRLFKGVHIVSTGNTDAILAFDFESEIKDASIRMYYTKNDTTHSRFHFPLSYSSPKTNYFKLTHDGSVVADYIDNSSKKDLLFLQGMSGPIAKIELPDLSTLSNKILNYAELEFTAYTHPNDLAIFKAKLPPQLIAYQKRNGYYEMVDDAYYSLNSGIAGLRYFGGYQISNDTTGVVKYRMNLSSYLQRVSKGQASKTIYISIFNEAENARRLILCGPKHPLNPVRLKLAYTKI